MKQSDKTREMMDNISIAYADATVKKYPELRQILLDYARELDETGNYQLVAAKLCRSIEQSSLQNKLKLPEAIVTLYLQLKPEATFYRAAALSAMMIPVWFPN